MVQQAHARGYHREDQGRLSLVILGSIGTAPEELKIKPLFNILINKISIFEVIILLMFFAETIQIATCYYTNEKSCTCCKLAVHMQITKYLSDAL